MKYWTGSFMVLILYGTTFCGLAQPTAISTLNRSNLWFNEFVFLPGGSRGLAKAISATNENFRLALRYIGEERAGQPSPKLPNGITQSDISNVGYMVYVWPTIVPPKPINFYGKVVDENGQPVAGASVHFEWDGTVTNRNAAAFRDWPRISVDVTTDNNGLFSLKDKLGTQLDVSVGKAGYYSSRANRGVNLFKYSQMNLDVFYGGSDYYKPDSNQPVLYYLRKMGLGANTLVTSQYGVRDGLWVTVQRDGAPVSVDLLNRKAGSGSMEIRQTKPDYPAHGGAFESLSPSDKAK